MDWNTIFFILIYVINSYATPASIMWESNVLPIQQNLQR